ncbi:hypothetical protein SCORR_v1c07460 [Spiroplasma corruscae]|uniref:Uncharacterized protein n=1 Tax=Spiroplasma corruscae TaxID=216934 RepID=A0A222EPQ5_9MOLU|nr:hypothetical protein [Spiroplasma corruscae]ASP28518.1 hypothetical protein SCORR_v1c07460 [Spiroplasma corruscae]
MIKENNFNETDFIEYSDFNNLMIEVFGIGCSLCGIDDISYVSKNSPKLLGNVVKEIHDSKPDISDLELDNLLKEPIDAWQELDDYNATIGKPTFLCSECYIQLLNGEISVPKIEIDEK